MVLSVAWPAQRASSRCWPVGQYPLAYEQAPSDVQCYGCAVFVDLQWLLTKVPQQVMCCAVLCRVSRALFLRDRAASGCVESTVVLIGAGMGRLVDGVGS